MHAIIIISLLYSYVHAPTMFTNMHAEAIYQSSVM